MVECAPSSKILLRTWRVLGRREYGPSVLCFFAKLFCLVVHVCKTKLYPIYCSINYTKRINRHHDRVRKCCRCHRPGTMLQDRNACPSRTERHGGRRRRRRRSLPRRRQLPIVGTRRRRIPRLLRQRDERIDGNQF